MSNRHLRWGLLTVVVVLMGLSVRAERPAGFFVGGGFNLQNVNGDGYVTTCFVDGGWTDDPFSVVDDEDFGWNGRLLTGFHGTVGYRFPVYGNKAMAVSLALAGHLRKNGGSESFSEHQDDLSYNTFLISDTPILDSAGIYLAATRFDLITARFCLSYYIRDPFYVSMGMEYARIRLGLKKYYYFDGGLTGFLSVDTWDDALGYVIGGGGDIPLNSKFYLNTTFYYSLTHYTGSKFYSTTGPFNGTDIDIGGADLGMELRYYLK